MSRWLRPTEYELDGFDWLHGRDAGGYDGSYSLWSRESLFPLALILATPAILGIGWLVDWLFF